MNSWGADASVALIDLDTLEVKSMFTIPPDIGTSHIVGGPDDTAFINIGPDVWQVYPDGSHTIWGTFPWEFIVAYTSEGRMIAKSHNGTILYELFQDGSKQMIADGFHNIYEACVTKEDIIIVYEVITGNIVRLDPDGTKTILVSGILPEDYVNMGLDFDDQLYFNSPEDRGFMQVDIETRKRTIIPDVYPACVWNPGGFVFFAPGELILGGDQLSRINIKDKTNRILIQNIGATFAADIGPDNALYIGVSDCGCGYAQIKRIADDGTQSVYIDHLKGSIERIAFKPRGGLYVLTYDNDTYHLQYIDKDTKTPVDIPDIPHDDLMSIAVHPVTGNLFLSRIRGKALLEFDTTGLIQTHSIKIPWNAHEYRIAFDPDGALYAYIGRLDGTTGGPWIAAIDLDKKSCTEIAELSRYPGGGMGAIDVGPDGAIWLYQNPESILYKIQPEGEVTKFAINLPIDAPAIMVGQSENIYFTSAAGLFHIYRDNAK